jgi:hypothetical protein
MRVGKIINCIILNLLLRILQLGIIYSKPRISAAFRVESDWQLNIDKVQYHNSINLHWHDLICMRYFRYR